jgi:hypothetical protein
MIGTKKLSTIRKEIESALAPEGEDPIQTLDRQIASAKRRGESAEVMKGLKRFLQTGGRPKREQSSGGKRRSVRQRK